MPSVLLMDVGGDEWPRLGRSVSSLCCAGVGSWQPASFTPPAEALIKVLLYTYLLRLGEIDLGLGCGRGLSQSPRGETGVSQKMG